jgi:hypothetical protein
MKNAISQAIARRDSSCLRSLAERAPTEQDQAVLQLLADLIDARWPAERPPEKAA